MRVTVSSDQAIFLRGMAAILQTIKGVQLVGEAQNGHDALQLCKLTQPDMLLLDLKDPVEARRLAINIHQDCDKIRIILLHACPDDEPALEDLAAQRLYVFSRDVSEEEFKAAFERVSREPLTAVGTRCSCGGAYRPAAPHRRPAGQTFRFSNSPAPVN